MELFFYFFGLLLIIGSIRVIASRNNVHSVLWLIFSFCNASAIFLLLNAEFLAMTLIVVYVGAIAILFLFVVMMIGGRNLNIPINFRCRKSLIRSILVILIFSLSISYIIYTSTVLNNNIPNTQNSLDVDILDSNYDNTNYIGSVLYTEFMIPFQICGVILLTAIVATVALVLDINSNAKTKRKNQDIAMQINRSKISSLELIKDVKDRIKDIKYDSN